MSSIVLQLTMSVFRRLCKVLRGRQVLTPSFSRSFGVSRRFSNRKCLVVIITLLILYSITTMYELCVAKYDDADYNESSNCQDFFLKDALVNTSKCEIPSVNIWNEQTLPHFSGEGSNICEARRSVAINGLTFVDKQELVVNETVLEGIELKLSDITCCYRTIERVQQDINDYNRLADSKFEYSEQCHAINASRTTPISGFIKVICELKGYFWKNSPLYTDAHLIATFEPALSSESSTLRKKIEFWRNRPHLPRPPSVLLLGIDSTSRNQFHRMFPVTTSILEEKLSAFEMLGYTKVGSNTFPNLVPILSSFSEEELMQVCMPSYWNAQDNCPYIWKNYSSQNYVTAHIEDVPRLAIFNYRKTGFVEQPTDIYPRPWMISVFTETDCLDSMSSGQHVIRYLEDLITLAESHSVPYFITAWITGDTHGSKVGARNLDLPLSTTLLKLHERGLLQNSVLFLMGDHGYRWDEWRRTLAGWYEDRLPTMWIVLPSSLWKTFPMWAENLRGNSRQLSTPFDVHATLKQILLWNETSIRTSRGEMRGVSLFEKLPSRSCDEAGVPVQFCACSVPRDVEISSQIVRLAAQAVIRRINAMLPSSNCSVLGVNRIIGFAGIGGNEVAEGSKSRGSGSRFVIGIETAHGKITAEAVIGLKAESLDFEVLDVMQTSSFKLIENRHCLPEGAYGEWCECKSDVRMVR